MKLVVDTNVLVSGLFWQGPPHHLMELARGGGVTLVTSPALLAEISDVLTRPHLLQLATRAGTTPQWLFERIQASSEMTYPAPLEAPVCRDPDDDEVLACAIAARAGLIVSGDDDLLVLGAYSGIPIVTPAKAIELLLHR